MRSIIWFSLFWFFLFLPPICAAEWELDFQIDRELGLLTSPWRVPLTKLQTRFDLPGEVRPGPPPYDQQVMNAQNFPPVVPQQPNNPNLPNNPPNQPNNPNP